MSTLKELKLFDQTFEIYLSNDQINEALDRLAESLNKDFEGQRVVLVGVLDGAFMLLADLSKRLNLDLTIEFIKVKSYVGQKSTGKVMQIMGLQRDLEATHIILVEDIIDTGNTLGELYKLMEEIKPASVSVLTLLIKEDIFQNKFPVHYKGISIENKFVIGYGMDYDGLGRQYPDIYAAKG